MPEPTGQARVPASEMRRIPSPERRTKGFCAARSSALEFQVPGGPQGVAPKGRSNRASQDAPAERNPSKYSAGFWRGGRPQVFVRGSESSGEPVKPSNIKSGRFRRGQADGVSRKHPAGCQASKGLQDGLNREETFREETLGEETFREEGPNGANAGNDPPILARLR